MKASSGVASAPWMTPARSSNGVRFGAHLTCSTKPLGLPQGGERYPTHGPVTDVRTYTTVSVTTVSVGKGFEPCDDSGPP